MFKKAKHRAWESVKKGNLFIAALSLLISMVVQSLINSLAKDIIFNPIVKSMGLESLEAWAPGGVLVGKFLVALITFLIVSTVCFFLFWGTYYVILRREERKKKANPEVKVEVKPTTEELIVAELASLNQLLKLKKEKLNKGDK